MLETMADMARQAFQVLGLASTEKKNACLNYLAHELAEERDEILAANNIDIEKSRNEGLSAALIDRLTLNDSRLHDMAASVKDVTGLADPVGSLFEAKTLPNGLRIHKQRVPLGVIGVIYESRPNVTIEVASLTLKTGNALILRGGKETINTNRKLVNVIQTALKRAGLPAASVQFIDNPDRTLMLEFLRMHDRIDMLIPRGGNQLHQFCRQNSSIPVITGGIGICHLYVDANADLEKALPLIRNAKVQRPTVCNALDTLLVHESIAQVFLPRVIDTLKKDGVSFRAHENVQPHLVDFPSNLVQPAGPSDFDTEWLSLVLGLKVVGNLEEAIEHIRVHSTAHSDGILTEDKDNAAEFIRRVDSSVVYTNASTRFTDGGQLGLGGEVAVSTQRLHARGPMGLEELTTYKWVVSGEYHIRN